MTQLEDWLDQYRAELEKNASSRAATIEGLLLVGDYQACHDWLSQWQEEDTREESPAYKYNQAKTLLRCFGNAQRSTERSRRSQPLSRGCNGRANADEVHNPSVGFSPNTSKSRRL